MYGVALWKPSTPALHRLDWAAAKIFHAVDLPIVCIVCIVWYSVYCVYSVYSVYKRYTLFVKVFINPNSAEAKYARESIFFDRFRIVDKTLSTMA